MNYEMHYRTPFWKLALGGVIAGAALYFFPFLVPALAFVFLVGLMFRLFFGFGRWGGHYRHMRHAYAEQWRNMTDEQRQAIRERSQGRCCGPWERPADSTAPQPPTNA